MTDNDALAVRLDLAVGEAMEAFRLHDKEVPSYFNDLQWIGETSPHPSRRSLLARGLLSLDGERVVASEDLTRLVDSMASSPVIVRIRRRTSAHTGVGWFWCGADETLRTEITPQGVVQTLRFRTSELAAFVTVEAGFQSEREPTPTIDVTIPAADYEEFLRLVEDGDSTAAAEILTRHDVPDAASARVAESLSTSLTATNIAVAGGELPEDPRARLASWIEGEGIGVIAVGRSEVRLDAPEPEPDEPIRLESVSDIKMFKRVMRIFTTLREESG